MRRLEVSREAARDIDAQVAKILRGLGNPEPPLDLRLVRELQKLDRHYYSTSDDGALREFVSKVRVGVKQFAMRPTLVMDVIRGAGLRALWLPDQKRILLDSGVPKLKQRWAEAHEVAHSITPWHQEFLLGDDDETLNQECHEQLELEANYGAGRLLFLSRRFATEASDAAQDLGSVKALSSRFGNSMTSTLWRFVEEGDRGVPMFGVVSCHPHYGDGSGSWTCRYFIPSPTYATRFPCLNAESALGLMRTYCRRTRKGPLGRGEVTIADLNGEPHRFQMESFSNTYEVLTLGTYQRAAPIAIPMRSA